jgi:hypothetical protein
VGAAVLKTGSTLRTRKIVSMNRSDKKSIMLHCIQCILLEFHLKFSKKLRKIGWKREPEKIDCA